MNMDNALEATNLTKYYRDFLAVDHINFQVKKGEIFGFLGPNGAGKNDHHTNAHGHVHTHRRNSHNNGL
jgi:ABC-type uncharacterized transport system ATPase subunit